MSIKYNGGYIPAVGADGTTLVADSSTSTGLRYNPTTGNQNFAINGNLDIWQRGTSFASPATNAYLADRWQTIYTVNQTTSQQTTGVPVGSTYCSRITYTGAGAIGFQNQSLEASMAKMLAGKTVTLSVKLRRNATFNVNIDIKLRKSSTANASGNSGFSDIATTVVTVAQLPTGTTSADWYTATLTTTIPNDGTALGLQILIGEEATGSSGQYWEYAQVKLEIGSVATAMTLSGGTLQGELAACQRYYYRESYSTTLMAAPVIASSSTLADFIWQYPVAMRIAPTLSSSSATNDFLVYTAATGSSYYSSISFLNVGVQRGQGRITVSGYTAGQAGFMLLNQSGAFLQASAEL